MFSGMKRKERVEHVKMLDVEWGYWNLMDEDSLKEVMVKKRLEENKTLKRDEVLKKLNGISKAELIKKLVVHHVKQMI